MTDCSKVREGPKVILNSTYMKIWLSAIEQPTFEQVLEAQERVQELLKEAQTMNDLCSDWLVKERMRKVKN